MKTLTNKEIKPLLNSCENLLEIVEGVLGERWSVNGRRLVDTKQWCDFYVKYNTIKELVNNKK